MKYKQKCTLCHHEKRLYSHSLNKPMVSALAQAIKLGRPFNLQKDLVLTKNQYNNFQKLQYCGLIEKVGGSSSWVTTELAYKFIHRIAPISNKAFTLGKDVLDPMEAWILESEKPGNKFNKIVFVDEILKEDYKKLQDYLSDI